VEPQTKPPARSARHNFSDNLDRRRRAIQWTRRARRNPPRADAKSNLLWLKLCDYFKTAMTARCGCGEFANWTRTGHGQTVVAENSCSWSWKNRGKFLTAAWKYSVDFPGRCREIARLLRECYAGRHAGCCADCGDNCQVICEPSRQHWCELWRGHSPALVEMFPTNCRDMSQLLLG
jgi:hypothetical protein